MAASKVGALLLTAFLFVGQFALAEDSGPPLTVGEIVIDTGSIYTPEEVEDSSGALRLLRKAMNGLHVDTRHHVLRREILFEPGDTFDPELLEETERNLRDLGFLTSASVVAIDTTSDGRVNIKVATRESWTLRTTLAFTLSSGGDTRWRAQLSEGNFLGHGVTVGAGVGSDENASYWNAFFYQRRLLGRKIELGFNYSNRQDGYSNTLNLSRPFFAQDDSWGFDVLAWNSLADRRYYLSNAGPAGVDPGANQSLYARLPFDNNGFEGRVLFRVSPVGGRIWRTGAGVRYTDTVYDIDNPPYELSDGRYDDLGWLTDPDEPFARDQGRTFFPFIWIQSLGRRWEKARFVMQYGSIEDLSAEFRLDLKMGPAGGRVGSTTGHAEDRFRIEGVVSRWFALPRGHMYLQGVGQGDAGSSRVSWYRYEALAGWVGKAGAEMSPWITRLWGEYGQGSNLNGDRALLLGLDRGMRTLDFDGMAGDHLARWNIEQGKAMPWDILGLVRAGFAVFYNGGRAWWKDEGHDAQDIRHELGLGLRVGPTRSAHSMVSRIDLAWDLNGSGSPVFTATSRGYF